jgi:hypothetical protein
MRQSKTFLIFTFSFFSLFILFSINTTKIQAASFLCYNINGDPAKDSLYRECPLGTSTDEDCSDLDGDSRDGCSLPNKWQCPSDGCAKGCDIYGTSGAGCGSTICSTKYQACECVCVDTNGDIVPIGGSGGGSTDGCTGGAPNTTCDAGETIFNCTDDCLDPGIPRKSIMDILNDLIEWILGIGLLLSVTYLVWGGINYISSSGDMQKTENARKTVKYALLGILVIGLSYAAILALDTIFVP